MLKLEKVHGKTKIDCGSLCLEKKLNLLITADIKKPLIKSLKPNNSMDWRESFTKNKIRVKKSKETGDSRYLLIPTG